MRLLFDQRFMMRFFMLMSIASTLFSQLYAAQCFPPNLVIQKITGDTLTLSALVVATDDAKIPDFIIGNKKQQCVVLSQADIKGWTFYRYIFDISKDGATFDFGTNNFTIPSFTDGLHCFYTSCADAQPGVSENWKKFYAYAKKMKACVHMKGGDNIPYPDDGIDEIFHNDWSAATITKDQQEKVIGLYLRLYLQALAQLPTSGTIIPAIVQRDDHDSYDGRGSLGDKEKNAIPTFIRKVADMLFLLLQLHITEQEKDTFDYFGGHNNYSKIYQFPAKEAVLQVDGRGERTRQQICSPETWGKIWSRLDAIQDCKTLYVMLGIPIVFPAMPKAEQLVKLIQQHPLAAQLTKKFLGGNRDGSPEPLDDVYYDHWDAHVAERDILIQKLQEFSKRNGAKVILVSGDVHSASTGVITHDDWPTIYQITSSGVGSTGPSRTAVGALDMLSHLKLSKTDNGNEMRLEQSLCGADGKKITVVEKRNCAVIRDDRVVVCDENGTEYKSNLLTSKKEQKRDCCTVS